MLYWLKGGLQAPKQGERVKAVQVFRGTLKHSVPRSRDGLV
jgi:hypothetical protein